MAEGSECILLRALLIVHPLYTCLFMCVRWRECKVCCCGDVLLTCAPCVFFEQKKAEEAHRILEGLGPRVELVSPHLSPYFLFFTYRPSFSCVTLASYVDIDRVFSLSLCSVRTCIKTITIF